MLEAAGGLLKTHEAAELLGTSTMRIEDKVAKNQLIGLKLGNQIEIPAFQIHQGKPLPHLETILSDLQDQKASEVVMCDYLLNDEIPSHKGPISVYEALRDGATDDQLAFIKRTTSRFFEPGR